ncbi:MAG: hypothetical protein LBF38_07090 [Deltaproteobacteria bacterium]|nr:hypothetical protein [Deltaproteobacteria bacterium]
MTVLDSLAAALNPAVDGLIGQAVPEDPKEFQKWFLKILPALKRLDKRGQNIVKACLEAMPRV